MADILEVREVSKRYGAKVVLEAVSMGVPRGSIFGLLGPNGAGKTSLIRIINQITYQDSGEVLFNGAAMSAKNVAQIGYLPEERGLYKKMKVGEQLVYLAQLKGLSKAEASKRLQVYFEKFQIGSWYEKKVEELSKGMQQKVQFISTVIHQPEMLILDEPFSGFDPVNAELLKREILELKEKGITIILSTHNMASVEELCENIVLLNNSKVILSGNVQEIRQKHSRNIYEVGYCAGDGVEVGRLMPDGCKVLEEEDLGMMRKARVEMGGNAVREVLKMLLERVEIKEFREVLPTMNEIFISKVNN